MILNSIVEAYTRKMCMSNGIGAEFISNASFECDCFAWVVVLVQGKEA